MRMDLHHVMIYLPQLYWFPLFEVKRGSITRVRNTSSRHRLLTGETIQIDDFIFDVYVRANER